MKFNHVIGTLRCWCNHMTERYSAEYDEERRRTGTSLRFFRYLVTTEMQFKLSTLLEKEFTDYPYFLRTVKELVPVHYDPTLKGPLGQEQAYHVRAAESAFADFLNTVAPDHSQPQIPYVRNIIGQEAESIIAGFRTVWGYFPDKYWYPLCGEADESKLFIMTDYIENYWDQIRLLIGLPATHIYEHGESWYPGIPACAEVDEIVGYGGCEAAYTNKSFSWMIYFSHENTVTFAGSIVPQVRQILKNEAEHWNRWEDL